MRNSPITITVCNRQRTIPVRLAGLQDFAQRAFTMSELPHQSRMR